ncbi:hypothetical protein EDC96DRAFT_445820, partial [Choanephora cucurbitarum]
LSYILFLPKTSVILFEESWPALFRLLYEDENAGTLFDFERTHQQSMIRIDDTLQPVSDIFPLWLKTIAFEQKGLFMQHAIDVAIMLDTLIHDPRLNLKHLVPVIKMIHENKRDAREDTINMLVQLITRIDQPADEAAAVGVRYLVLHFVSSAESKWPGLFQLVLENIFSKAIAMHIVDNEGSVNIEKILSNLAMLFGSSEQDKPGFSAFQQYIVGHWRQVSLLFLNHPSIECRVMGYRVLCHSRFWQHISVEEYPVVSKLLMDAWFRHMKGRYVRLSQQDETHIIEEQQKLNTTSMQLDRQSLLDQVIQPMPSLSSAQLTKPPQFITTIQLSSQNQKDMRDLIYVDNIQRTASLFDDLPSSVSDHFLAHLCRHWQPKSVALNSYDDVLPMNLPHQSDIVIGSAFKDHPILFLIFEKYDHTQTRDIMRGVLVYFIVFWHMKEVANVPTTLSFATQLEETTRLVLLLKPVS